MSLISSFFKKDKSTSPPPASPQNPTPPEFRFVRSDTVNSCCCSRPSAGTRTLLTSSPQISQDVIHPPSGSLPNDHSSSSTHLSLSRPRSGSTASRLSFHNFGHRRSRSGGPSANIPANLPTVDDKAKDREAQWEQRATVLVGTQGLPEASPSRSHSSSNSNTQADDV
jgi:hypothetical protein